MNKINQLIKQVKEADAIVVGGGSGMSNAAGMDFWYSASPLFLKHMKYYYDKYHFQGIFKRYYTQFDSQEEHWAYIVKMLNLIFTEPAQKPTYDYLKTVIGNKPTHYVTTNQDGLFKKYFGEDAVSEIQDHKLDREDFPKSPVDDSPLIAWVRGPEFLEDERYNYEYQKVNHFLAQHRGEKILFLEMGVGRMTPMFIQEPFWEMTQYMRDAFYININPKDAITNPVIRERSLLIGDDINEVLKEASEEIKEGR